jgi:hypothetical protein
LLDGRSFERRAATRRWCREQGRDEAGESFDVFIHQRSGNMISKWIAVCGVASVALVSSQNAGAQEKSEGPSYFTTRIDAPKQAFELAVGGTYTQGLSSPAGGMGTTDLTKAGAAVELQAGYRLMPELSLSLSGEYNEFNQGDRLSSSAGTRGMVAGANATYHLLPYDRIDPWVRAGVGYRMLWVVGDATTPDTLWHGFQFVKLNVGVDLRTTEDLALGPMVGVDVNEFVWKNPTGSVGDQEISDKRVVPFVYAGLQGRFDLLGTREPRNATLVGAK